MKKIVVDASVVLAGFFKDGVTRRLLLYPPEGVLYCAPEDLREEVEGKVPTAVKRLGVSEETARALLQDILARIQVIPLEALEPHVEAATRTCSKAAAQGDEWYVACALAVRAPIWTFDPDFGRIAKLLKSLEIWTTQDVVAAGLAG